MKFTKGLVVGGLLATGLLMMYNDTDLLNKNKMMKKGKKFTMIRYQLRKCRVVCIIPFL